MAYLCNQELLEARYFVCECYKKIAVPVTLQVFMRVDSYVSILKSHRDCLRRLSDRKTIGICDQLLLCTCTNFSETAFHSRISFFLN